ncbi:MAG TPA: AAA family ATPase [Solirubrobacteraceae bacterium]|nr:AAA family ATPase [Solirubrobacteraceae bacterium]
MPFSSRFVGRTGELDAFDAALAALEGGTPRAIEVVGPAGIGKSRLLSELGGRAAARGHVVLSGSGAELEQDLPYWVFVDALDDYVADLDPRRLDRLDEATRSELGQILPALADASAATDTGLHERYRTHRAARVLLERLAIPQPLVLLLDDFHWADPASTDLLSALLRRPPAAGVLLALTARPRQLPTRLATALERAHRAGVLARVELPPLTRAETRELVGEHAELFYDETGGNPFYLEQLARAPLDLPPPADAGAGVSLAGVQVPPMVAAALTEELSLLTAPVRRVLDGASVAGDPFEVDLAAAAADLAETDVLDAIDDLARLELVRETDMPRRFRFRHPIVRRAVYEASPGGWRVGAHERVASALSARGASAGARAHHVERSARYGDAAAVAVLREAGREARSQAPATSARWLAAAVRVLPDTAPAQARVELLLPMAQALAATGQFVESHQTLLEILEILPSDQVAERVEVSTWCARVEHLLGLHEQAHDRLMASLDGLADEVSAEGLALLIELSQDGSHRMDYKSMKGWSERLVTVAEQMQDPLLRTVGLAAAARGFTFAGLPAQGRPLRDHAAQIIDGLSDGELAGHLDAIVHLAGAELYQHLFEQASAHAQRALAVGRATGQHQLFPVVFAILGITWMLRGHLQPALDPLEGNVEAARLSGNAQAISWSLYGLSQVVLATGDVERAMSAAQEAVDVGDDGKPSHHVAYAALVLAQAHLLTGKPDRGLGLLERASGGPDMPLVADSWRAYFLELQTRCRLALEDREAAGRAAALADVSANDTGLPLARAWADRAAAAVALDTGDLQAAANLAMRSAEAADAGAVPIEAALSRTLAGRALAAAGEPDRAKQQLEQAAGALDAVGAQRYRDAAERELRQLGHHIHRRSGAGDAEASGVDALTQRELEIARRIVDRRTNRQIAEELFLSRKTVETHIRNIFAKLGADSRVEVARMVERADRLSGART